jgi:hypothetical protein
MVKPIDITNRVIVPRPQPNLEKPKSFFIGRAPMDGAEEEGIEVEANPRDIIKQPHLDNSVVQDTRWKDLY